jgi:pimeloyl-ACP methyl ester carboxylesterase
VVADYVIEETGNRRAHGATFRSTRNRINDLGLVVKRFPVIGTPPRSGVTFVLVHGIGVSSRYFHPLAAELAKIGTVYLVDLPGYGAAPKPTRSVSIEDHADVLAGVLHNEGIEDAILVGHSMGTQVVSRLLVDHPELSDRLVLIAPTTDPEDRTLGIQARHLLVDLVRETLPVNLIVMTDYLFRCGVPYYLAQLPNLLDDHIEDRLPQLQARTLVLRGERDPIVSREWAQRVADLVPRGSFHEVPGPHVTMHTDPARSAQLIAGLVDP